MICLEQRPKRAHPTKGDVTRTAFPSAPTAHEVAMRILRSGTVKRRRRPRPVLPGTYVLSKLRSLDDLISIKVDLKVDLIIGGTIGNDNMIYKPPPPHCPLS